MTDSQDSSANFSGINKNDDALLKALSLVLTSNGEYAKSVSALLDSDLEKAESLENMAGELKTLNSLTKDLIDNQSKLMGLLSDCSEDNKQLFINNISMHTNDIKLYIDLKLKNIFLEHGLKEDGTEHTPGDKIIIKVKNTLITLAYYSIAYSIGIALVYAFYKYITK